MSNKNIADDIMVELSSLSLDEQILLSEIPEYIEASKLYEQSFLAFLVDKFKSEFITTTNGQRVAEMLLNAIKTGKNEVLEHQKKELEEFKNWKKLKTKKNKEE